MRILNDMLTASETKNPKQLAVVDGDHSIDYQHLLITDAEK